MNSFGLPARAGDYGRWCVAHCGIGKHWLENPEIGAGGVPVLARGLF